MLFHYYLGLADLLNGGKNLFWLTLSLKCHLFTLAIIFGQYVFWQGVFKNGDLPREEEEIFDRPLSDGYFVVDLLIVIINPADFGAPPYLHEGGESAAIVADLLPFGHKLDDGELLLQT